MSYSLQQCQGSLEPVLAKCRFHEKLLKFEASSQKFRFAVENTSQFIDIQELCEFLLPFFKDFAKIGALTSNIT